MKKIIIIAKVVSLLLVVYLITFIYHRFSDIKLWMAPAFLISLGLPLFYSVVIVSEFYYKMKAKHYKLITRNKLKNIK